jgi:hypothetical protein
VTVGIFNSSHLGPRFEFLYETESHYLLQTFRALTYQLNNWKL